MATRLRASMRRSLPATRAAALSTRHPPGWCRRRRGERRRQARSAAGGVGSTTPPDSVTVRWARADAPLELVGREHHGGAGRHGLAHEAVEQVAAVGVEAGVGLVEQPQLGAAGDERGERGPPALAGRQPVDGVPASRPARPRLAMAVAISASVAPTVRPQKRTFSSTVRSLVEVVARARASPTWRRTARRSDRRSWPRTTASPEATATSPARPAAGWSCRRRSALARARSRRARRRASRRPEPGSARAVPRLLEGGSPAPWRSRTCEQYRPGHPPPPRRAGSGDGEGRRSPIGPRRRAPASAAGTVDQVRGLALVGRAARPHPHRPRRARAALRRLPAVGHRHPGGPGPGRPEPRVQQDDGGHHDGTDHGVPTTAPRHHRGAGHHGGAADHGGARRPRPRRRPRATAWPAWRSRGSASTRSSSRASASTTSARDRATTRTRRCPA